MTGINFKRKIDELWKSLSNDIDTVLRNKSEVLSYAEEILMLTDTAIRKLKIYVQEYQFKDWSEEIEFFKVTKPKFVSVYIYYSKLLAIESSKPYADPLVLKSYYETERANLIYFYQEHKEFISYYKRKATYLDKKYFVKFKFDFKLKLSAELYSYDESFSTSHDHTVSQILANDRLDLYLTTKINSDYVVDHLVFQHSPLEWTAPKVALIELLYALYLTKCFDAGKAEPSDIFRWAETALNINLGNYHKTLNEIKLRKTDRTKFLKLIQQNLEQYLDYSDE
ncbi:RteC domain-containing protein [Chryseobacterium sp. CFBP8996]|uniref:RteC domain-containing protein n=1 Tax=Chryseobacterium sp. CFBP8996 TaxID=3096529 RepID=UPI002A6A4AA0|nr:RteC domain-containing protein [Chryseobacterium sp. CFBP8996]MDY0930719.1 RteC domain-containing protein [Chryseobacterium sp. CFBP8996]